MDMSKLLKQLDDKQLEIAMKVAAEAEAQGVNPDHVLPLAFAESSFNPKVPNSSAGAIGVMQLMPKTAKGLKVDPHNLDENIRGGVTYFKELMGRKDINGDLNKAYIAYNAGPNTPYITSGKIEDIPSESLGYLDKILSLSGNGAESSPMRPSPRPSAAAPQASLEPNEQVVEPPAPTPTPTAANPENVDAGQFDFDYEKFKKSQETAQAAEPYHFDPLGDVIAGGAGATAGGSLGLAYSTGKGMNALAHVPAELKSALTEAAKAATPPPPPPPSTPTPSGSPAGVKNWAASQGYSDRGAKTYSQAHQFETGTRQGAGIRNPTTGEVIKPTFRVAKPPVYEAPAAAAPVVEAAPAVEAAPGALQKAGMAAKTIAGLPMVRGALGGLGVGMGAAETYNRMQQGDKLGATLAGISTAGSAASMVPGLQIPGAAVGIGGMGALALADYVRNKQAAPDQPAQPAQPSTIQEKEAALRQMRQASQQQAQQRPGREVSGKLVRALDVQMQNFVNQPVQQP
jgi:hypothetical protein